MDEQSEYKRQFVWNRPLTTSQTSDQSDSSAMSSSQHKAPDSRASPVPGFTPTQPWNTDHMDSIIHSDAPASNFPTRRPDSLKTSQVVPGKVLPVPSSSGTEQSKSPVKHQSEYHSKFKPFNDYVYVEGDGFKKLGKDQKAQLSDKVKSWFKEVEERNSQACKYRARSQNGKFLLDQM